MKSPKTKSSAKKKKSNERLCPFCQESIKVLAIKCKHCGSDLDLDDLGDPKQYIKYHVKREADLFISSFKCVIQTILGILVIDWGQEFEIDFPDLNEIIMEFDFISADNEIKNWVVMGIGIAILIKAFFYPMQLMDLTDDIPGLTELKSEYPELVDFEVENPKSGEIILFTLIAAAVLVGIVLFELWNESNKIYILSLLIFGLTWCRALKLATDDQVVKIPEEIAKIIFNTPHSDTEKEEEK
ncbi:MAG: hypothetical protein V6Z81_06995 [Parvularculales bacterium]